MIELIFLKELILIIQANQKNVIFVTIDIWYFLDKGFTFQTNVSNGCHDLLMMSMNLNNIANLTIHGGDYCSIISRISKNEVVSLFQKAELNEKGGAL